MNKKITKFNRNEINEFLKQPITAITETMAGILESGKSELVLATGRVIEAGFKREFLRQLGKELNEYRKQGKIKNNCFESENARESFWNLLKFIDEAPDKAQFQAMKSIFFMSIAKTASQEDEILAYELMQSCKKLSAMEILILSSNYNIIIGAAKPQVPGITTSIHSVPYWADVIAKQIGHNLPQIVLRYENHLVELQLISDRHYTMERTTVTNDFEPTQYFRLTSLGYKLCEFITKHN